MIFHPNRFLFHVGHDTTIGSESFTYEDLVTAARHVAWQYSIGSPGQFHMPGDMLRYVLDAMVRADPTNLARLRRAFPLHAALIDGIHNDDPATRSMILNLLEYRTFDGWTTPALGPGTTDTNEEP